jgi:hypothetical protein
MKNFILTISLLAITAVAAFGQTVTPTTQNIYAFGLSWNQSASTSVAQQIAGTAMYARQQNSAGTYVFTAIDIVPTTVTPVTITTQTSVGVAQKVLAFGGWTFYATAAAGPSWTGTNTGWAWLAGGMGTHSIGKNGWQIMPNVRTIKSSVGNNSGYQLIIGVMLGFGS